MCTERSRQSGLSLVELVIFIVVVAVGVSGVLLAFNMAIRGSADPQLRKQAIAIAESLLGEIEQQAFTYCDPQDPNVLTAASLAGCASLAEALGPEAAAVSIGQPHGENRYQNVNGGDSPFDNVSDYHGFVMPDARCAGICGSDGIVIDALAGFTATVTIADIGAVAPFADIPSGGALKISVRVTGRGQDITLVGYRLRYAPNSPG